MSDLVLKDSNPNKRVYFYTLGCRLNQAEEESIKRQFLLTGFTVVDPKYADIIIINTCSVTSVADKKSKIAIRKLKRENGAARIVVMGCAAKGVTGMSEVDLIISNQEKDKTFEIISSSKLISSKFTQKPRARTQNLDIRTRALLKVQDGCNNFCTYCIVPYLRGREKSVPFLEVLKEAKRMEKMGYREIVISGVNVGKYSSPIDKTVIPKIKTSTEEGIINLEGLLRTILSETKIPRIRLSSINPQDVSEGLINLWAKESRLCRHLHLSLQSGSDLILKKMGRPYTKKQYLDLVKKIRKQIPGIAITTDLIVGFPGETEREFQETKDFVKKILFARIHVFPYSKRERTKAANMLNQINENEKKNRSKKLRSISKNLSNDFKKKFIGTEQEVLFEGFDRKLNKKNQKKKDWLGLTSNYIKVRYESEKDLKNKILKIRLNKSNIL